MFVFVFVVCGMLLLLSLFVFVFVVCGVMSAVMFVVFAIVVCFLFLCASGAAEWLAFLLLLALLLLLSVACRLMYPVIV